MGVNGNSGTRAVPNAEGGTTCYMCRSSSCRRAGICYLPGRGALGPGRGCHLDEHVVRYPKALPRALLWPREEAPKRDTHGDAGPGPEAGIDLRAWVWRVPVVFKPDGSGLGAFPPSEPQFYENGACVVVGDFDEEHNLDATSLVAWDPSFRTTSPSPSGPG